MTDQVSREVNVLSGNIQMRISNNPTMAGAEWEPLHQTRAWNLAALCTVGKRCQVYAQVRDGALNESNIVKDSILLEAGQALYLPLLTRQLSAAATGWVMYLRPVILLCNRVSSPRGRRFCYISRHIALRREHQEEFLPGAS
jgi:hypothetical protein